MSSCGCALTGHGLVLNLLFAIGEKEQLVSVREVNFRLDVGLCRTVDARVVDTRISRTILVQARDPRWTDIVACARLAGRTVAHVHPDPGHVEMR